MIYNIFEKHLRTAHNIAFYTRLWDETVPTGAESKSLGDNRIRQMKADIRERLATEHEDVTDESGGKELRHLPGNCMVLLATGTSGVSMSEGGMAFDTELHLLLRGGDGGAATTMDLAATSLWYDSDDEDITSGMALTADGSGGLEFTAINQLTYSGEVMFNGTASTSYADLDLSSEVGENVALVFLEVINNGGTSYFYFRTNGASNYVQAEITSSVWQFLLLTDSNGVIEWKGQYARSTTINLLAYVVPAT